MRDPLVPAHGRRSWWPAAGITVSAAAAVALRVPFMHLGSSPDEGGYAYIAEQWARGARLAFPYLRVHRLEEIPERSDGCGASLTAGTTRAP